MIQAIVWITISIVSIAIIGYVLHAFRQQKNTNDKNEWDVLHFIKSHPDKASLYMTKDNEVIAASAPQQYMPVATVTPIFIAMEYVNQVTKGFLDAHKNISLADIDLYTIPHVDQGAHDAWVKKHQQKNRNTIYSDKVQLREVVQGMLHHQSHANTAFLLQRLNMNQINQHMTQFHVNNHEELFYFTAAPLLPVYLHVEESLSTRKIKLKLQEMPQQDFHAYCGIIHGLLTQSSADHLIEQHKHMDIDDEIQHLLTQKLPRSTTKQYANILNKLYSEKDVVEEYKDVLTKLTAGGQWTYIGDGNRAPSCMSNHIVHGMNINEDNLYVVCVFMNELTPSESAWINENIERFLSKTLSDNTFQEEVKAHFSV